MKYNSLRSRGFTLVEILTVVAIVGILAAIVLVSYGAVKKSVRDKQRISDISSIQIALRLYRESNGQYPNIPGSVVVGEGGALDSMLSSFMTTVPHDPLGPGNASYQYIYDSRQDCRSNGNTQDETVLYAIKTENPGMANWGRNPSDDGVCEPTGATTQAEYYGVIVGPEVP